MVIIQTIAVTVQIAPEIVSVKAQNVHLHATMFISVAELADLGVSYIVTNKLNFYKPGNSMRKLYYILILTASLFIYGCGDSADKAVEDVSEMASDAIEAVTETASELMDDAKEMISDDDDSVADASDDAVEAASDAVDDAADALEDASDAAEDAAEDASDAAEELAADADEYVED